MKIALVGSGASLHGAGLGEEIDAHDLVMRLQDCAWHVPSDHGIKWTHGLIPGPWSKHDFSCFTGPSEGWLSYHFGAPHNRLPEGTDSFDVESWNKRGRALSTKRFRITRGFGMFVAATRIPGVTQISGYGFDAMAALGYTLGKWYHPAYNSPDPSLTPIHDGHAEGQMLQTLSEETGLPINLSTGAQNMPYEFEEGLLEQDETVEEVRLVRSDILAVQLTRRLPAAARQELQKQLEKGLPKGVTVKLFPPDAQVLGVLRNG